MIASQNERTNPNNLIFADNMAFRVPHAQLKHPVSETYISSEYHKCFALQHLQYQFFGIFVAAVPNHSMR